MGSSTNRGRVIWVLASSRPDLIEVDLKRPGRVERQDSAVPDYYAAGRVRPDPHALRKRGLAIPESSFGSLNRASAASDSWRRRKPLPSRSNRQVRTGTAALLQDVLVESLTEYQSPIAPEVMAFQIQIAASEATALEFVPLFFRRKSAG